MPNILPETEVRGSLLVDILRAKGEGYIYQRVPVVLLCVAIAF